MKFDLSAEEINIVLFALSKLPYDQVINLIPKIQEQGRAQLAEAEQPK